MNLSLLAMLGIAGGGLYSGYQFSKTIKQEVDSTLFSKFLAPLNALFYNYYSNKGLMVNEVLEDSIMINTPEKELYGFKVEGGSNTPFYFGANSIERVYRNYKDKPSAFFFYVILILHSASSNFPAIWYSQTRCHDAVKKEWRDSNVCTEGP